MLDTKSSDCDRLKLADRLPSRSGWLVALFFTLLLISSSLYLGYSRDTKLSSAVSVVKRAYGTGPGDQQLSMIMLNNVQERFARIQMKYGPLRHFSIISTYADFFPVTLITVKLHTIRGNSSFNELVGVYKGKIVDVQLQSPPG